jgi:hypothetical protein
MHWPLSSAMSVIMKPSRLIFDLSTKSRNPCSSSLIQWNDDETSHDYVSLNLKEMSIVLIVMYALCKDKETIHSWILIIATNNYM